MTNRMMKYEATRDPALRPDGKPYTESIEVAAKEVCVDDVFPGVGRVMRVTVGMRWVVVQGRLVNRTVRSSERFTIIRSNKEK